MMRGRRARATAVLLFTAVLLTPTPPVGAADAVDLTGQLSGVAYEIRVPADWNGTLVMYAHGYRDAADHPGEPDRRDADAFTSEASERAMLDAGYAIAGSAYASNGWAVADGIKDTKALRNYFEEVVGVPDTTLLAGFSMGSVVAFESIEHLGGHYDGALPGCAIGAGAPRTFDGTLAVASAYDAVFGWPREWGKPGDVRDDLDFDTEVLPVLSRQRGEPGAKGRFEFMRIAAGVPEGPEWPFSIFYYTTEGRAELERRAGGAPVQNLDHRYRVSAEDRSYLDGFGVRNAEVERYLDAMNANRVSPDRTARRYLEKYAEYTGKVKHPVLTLGTTIDALVPPAHINAYDQTVAAAGRAGSVVNAWTNGNGHCAFTAEQLVTAVGAVEHWVQSGLRPGPLPAGQGFVELTPPPWPYP